MRVFGELDGLAVYNRLWIHYDPDQDEVITKDVGQIKLLNDAKPLIS